ncbi:MAG: Nif3-like dinuclear metal center hexameric protein [Bacteroidia bacterium]|nr:Nif3-like dinuclear metal center hexameric protein [Bacteroidia bacterium]
MDNGVLRVADICAALEERAPAAYAESYDNVGLLVGEPDSPATKALVALDVTEETVAYAVRRGCNLIVSHHPIWFGAKKRLTGEDPAARCIMAALRAKVAICAAHTNLDNVFDGVNAKICDRLGLEQRRILAPAKGNENVGSGMIGTLPAPMSVPDFLALVQKTFQTPVLRHNDKAPEKIWRVAVCGGAGSFLLPAAQDAGADALITADVSYHKFFDASLLLVDVGHYESEQFTPEILLNAIKNKFPNFEMELAPFSTNPVRYYIARQSF